MRIGTSAVFTLLFLPLGAHLRVCSITDRQVSRLYGGTEAILYSLSLSRSKADEVKLLNILEFHNSWLICSLLQEKWKELEYNGPSQVLVINLLGGNVIIKIIGLQTLFFTIQDNITKLVYISPLLCILQINLHENITKEPCNRVRNK
jgi:hypothetical protein